MYVYEVWLLNNETDAIKHFILISYIFTYYHLQYTPLLYPSTLHANLTLFETVLKVFFCQLLQDACRFLFHSFNRLKSCSF